MERLRKLLAEVETNEDPDFDYENNGREYVLEDIFSDHESFIDHVKKSEEGGDSGNEDVNNLEWFSSKDGLQSWKTKFMQNIRCHNIMSRLPGTKGQAKDVTSPLKSYELFLNDNMIQLIAERTNIFIDKRSQNFSRESDARKTNP
ncbi:hypothetical protein AVEN_42740-1 [Araneus ventricosus]|uniref:PiggyBac transposable element-derived protein domain-containing protein n=1 Tax=Araneus ventricosus TaxID=182803 RepID=A0A4Y2K9B4_ARAVE|nr:hypothetical protein AVEN_42740-1 [Araneus ventricosus]